MARIFISYAREDAQQAKILYQRLVAEGFKPWMDKVDLLPGQQWRPAIEKALRQADFFLLLLSNHSVKKRGFVQREIRAALDIWQEKMEDDIYLIPVLIEALLWSEVPDEVNKFQGVDFFEEDGWEQLLKALRYEANRRGITISVITKVEVIEKSVSKKSQPHSSSDSDNKSLPSHPPQLVALDAPEKSRNQNDPSHSKSKVDLLNKLSPDDKVGLLSKLYTDDKNKKDAINPNPDHLTQLKLEPHTKVENPSQGDVLPNIDLTGVIATPKPTAVPPKGMRSYTEVIALNVRMEMQAIPGGEFLMGSPEKQGYADEYPLHRATLSPFYIGKYPVTQSQWGAVMRTNPSHFNGPNHPVDSITWDEAFEYCRRLSYATSRIYRLPTEAEWEFACRAGMQTQFNYGDEEEFVVQYAWCLTNSGNHTHPVGEKKPNGWGLYDMHGNVWEWCHDWYAADYYQHSPKVNPFGPAKGTSRVLRGGSWYSLPNYCRNAGRSNHQPDQRDPLVGFRVVCEARNA